MDAQRRTSSGRLRRLSEELIEEEIGVIEATSDADVLVDEIDFARRPPRHERRVPSYGSFVLPESHPSAWSRATGLTILSADTRATDDDDARRYADGLTSWTVRTKDGIDYVVVFDRAAGSERDLVVLAEVSGAIVVQRHPAGDVRVAGDFGVARYDGIDWHREVPIAEWLPPSRCGLDPIRTGTLDEMLRFAVHDLGSAGIGAILVYCIDAHAEAQIEHRVASAAPLRIDRVSSLGPLRHVLRQIDGAAIFDVDGRLVELGARLVPSLDAEAEVEPIGGTRHTSARRYSFDEPTAFVIAVSEDGPVTVFRAGQIIGRSSTQQS